MPKRSTIKDNPLDKGPLDSIIPSGLPPDRPEERAAVPDVAVKQISVRLPVTLYRRLKVAVAKSDESQQEYIARVLEEHLRRQGEG